MIDEKFLDNMEKLTKELDPDEVSLASLESFRLIRLGLWAEQHGIPALEHYQSSHYDMRGYSCARDKFAGEALAKLPKEKE